MAMRIQLSERFTYKKLIKFTAPSILMMIFTSIYSVVDGFFVSNFAGKTAFSAVNLIFPFLMVVATVGFMLGTGGSALVSKTLGEKQEEKANQYFSLFTYFTFGVGVVIAILSMIFIRHIASFLGAKGELLDDCVAYAYTILPALPFFVMQLFFQSFFVTAERPGLGFLVTIIAGVTNMILDAILVISLPYEYKLIGAALATGISQTVGGVIPLIYFMKKRKALLRFCKTKFYFTAIGKACVNGSSEFMSNVSMNLVAMLYNLQLLKYVGENGVAAYGVMMYVCFVFAGAFMGYTIGSAPIVGYNLGANNPFEVKNVLKKSAAMIGVCSIIVFSLAQAFASPISKIFVGYDGELLSLTVSGFRLYSFCFLLMGFAIFISGFFTALNDGLTSALISFLRTLVFELLSVLLLPLILGVNGIWLSVVVAEFMAVTVGVSLLVIKRKKYGY